MEITTTGPAKETPAPLSTALGGGRPEPGQARGGPGSYMAVFAPAASPARIASRIWHLLADPDARYADLGSSFHDTRINWRCSSMVSAIRAAVADPW